jgi:hypothetical protein
MLLYVIIVFYVCLFPVKIWNLIFMFFGHKPAFRNVITLRRFWYINVFVRVLFYVNSIINPIFFNCLSRKFRLTLKNLLIFKLLFNCKWNAAATSKSKNNVKMDDFEIRNNIQIIISNGEKKNFSKNSIKNINNFNDDINNNNVEEKKVQFKESN